MGILHAACIVAHFCIVAFAAPPLSPPSLSLVNNPNLNVTAPFSIIQAFSANRLPSDPFFYKVPDSDETVRFYGYGTSLPRKDVIHAIVVASRRIKRHGSSNEPIPDKVLRYGSGDVYLVMHHTGRLTWRLWETALRGIMDFLERYEYVDMEFDVGQVGFERIFGTGALGSMKS